jgi:SRSO17 transposase
VAVSPPLAEKRPGNPERSAAAGLPEAVVVVCSTGEIARAALDRPLTARVRFGVMLADTGDGASAVLRQGLRERGVTWAVGIPRRQKVDGPDVALVAPGGRKRRPMPD